MFQFICRDRFFVTLTCFLLCASTSFSQNYSDLLQEFLETGNSDQKRLASLMAADLDQLSISDDSTSNLLSMGLDLAKKTGDDKSLFTLMLMQADIAESVPKDKMQQLDELISISKAKGWDSLYIAGQYWKGKYFVTQNDLTKAGKLFTKILADENELINQHTKIHGLTCLSLGEVKMMQGDDEKASELYHTSLNLYEELKDSSGICAVLYKIANIYVVPGDMESFKRYNDRSLTISQKIGNKKEECKAYLNYGSIYIHRRMYDSALVYALKGEKLAIENKDKESLGHVSNKISICYQNLGQMDKSLQYAIKALSRVKPYFNKVRYARNLSNVYMALGEYDVAAKYLDTALVMANKIESDLSISGVHKYYGLLEMRRKNYQKAITKYNLALDKYPKDSNGLVEYDIYIGLSMLHHYVKDYEKSNYYVAQGLQLKNNYARNQSLYAVRAVNFEKLGDFELAYKAHQELFRYKDSAERKSSEKLEQTILAKYSVEKAEKEAELSKMDKEVSDLNASKQKRMKLFGFLLLGLSLLSIVLILGRHTKYKQEKEQTFRLQAESAQQAINHSREILANQNKLILDKNRIIAELRENIQSYFSEDEIKVEKLEHFLENKILTKEDWDTFKKSFTLVYPSFITSVIKRFNSITEAELRLLCLYKLELTKKEIAEMLGVLPKSVQRTVNRFQTKHNLSTTTDLAALVSSIM